MKSFELPFTYEQFVAGGAGFKDGEAVGLWQPGIKYRGVIRSMSNPHDGILINIVRPEPALLDGTTGDAGILIKGGHILASGYDSTHRLVYILDLGELKFVLGGDGKHPGHAVGSGMHVALAEGDTIEFVLGDFAGDDWDRVVLSITPVANPDRPGFIDGWEIGVKQRGVITSIDEFDDGRVAHVAVGDRQVDFYVGDYVQPGQEVEFVGIEPTLKWNLAD